MTEPVTFLDGRVRLHPGDCLATLAGMEPSGVDSCVTDPPYGLQFMGREWDKLWRNKSDADQRYVDDTAGLLTSRARKLPDYSATNPQQMQVWFEAWAREVLRVLKPGAHLVAFGAPKNAHRLACAIEDAGFEIRDGLMWMFGSGFPKSLDVSKAIDKAAGAERNVVIGKSARHNSYSSGSGDTVGFQTGVPDITAPATPEAAEWQGWGTALKPAYEPIILARKPLSEKTVAANVLRWGTGALNIDGCRVGTEDMSGQWDRSWSENTGPLGERYPQTGRVAGKVVPPGRWPANIVHDGSSEVVGAFPDRDGAVSNGRKGVAGIFDDGIGGSPQRNSFGDAGSAARFFYSAKADADDRIGSKHPTVKPVDLMRWLVRLVTPPGGTVLDLFAGTGTTGEAAFYEGFNAILCEREAEYIADIERRMKLALAGPDERLREIAKTKGEPDLTGTLFEGVA